MEYEYKLTSDEIDESLLSINWKREGPVKKINIIILSIIIIFCIYQYSKETKLFIYIILSVISILLLFYSLYISKYIRKNKANKISQKNGVYKIKVENDGIIIGDNKKILFDKNKCQLLESEKVITITVNKEVICLPKHVINKDINLLKDIARNANFSFLKIKTKGE